MSISAIVGANWGDEGKGKMTDVLARESDYVVRFQGGANAGHTIQNGQGKFALHLLPSGVFHSHVTNVLGSGVALDIRQLHSELQGLENRGIPAPALRVSDRAQVVLPYHITLDCCEEDRLAERAFGSTRKGIAPFYADKYAKYGIQVADLFVPERLQAQLERSLPIKNTLLENLYAQPPIELDSLLVELQEQAKIIAPYICDTTALLHDALDKGKRILLEGQLGALRDPDHGIYPYTTSSSPLAGFAAVGAGLLARSISRVVTVAKAYSSCVGAGAFATELTGEIAEHLRKRGSEYGATTGRPRRIGWFDAVATRYGAQLQGTTEIALSLLDVLSGLEEIPICTAYRINGETTSRFPISAKLENAEPILRSLAGWKENISLARAFSDLPEAAQRYVETVEECIGFPIRWISVGPDRDAIITR